jgi:hypothetical protein
MWWEWLHEWPKSFTTLTARIHVPSGVRSSRRSVVSSRLLRCTTLLQKMITKNLLILVTIKVMQSHYRPWQALRVPGSLGSLILRQSAHKGGKVLSRRHRPPLPPGNISGTHFCWKLSNRRAIVRPVGLCKRKIPMTPSVIDPATFRFVAQCLNYFATACPYSYWYVDYLLARQCVSAYRVSWGIILMLYTCSLRMLQGKTIVFLWSTILMFFYQTWTNVFSQSSVNVAITCHSKPEITAVFHAVTNIPFWK